jgi:hypothetical protein
VPIGSGTIAPSVHDGCEPVSAFESGQKVRESGPQDHWVIGLNHPRQTPRILRLSGEARRAAYAVGTKYGMRNERG